MLFRREIKHTTQYVYLVAELHVAFNVASNRQDRDIPIINTLKTGKLKIESRGIQMITGWTHWALGKLLKQTDKTWV